MNNHLVYYRFYHDNIDSQEGLDSPVENINVKIADVYADDEYQAELRLMEYFGDNVISIIKSERIR